MQIQGDGSYNSEEFNQTKSLLLGSEEIRFVAKEKSGFIVLTDRRFVYIRSEKKGNKIQNAIPLDLVVGGELQKKDTLKVAFHKIRDSGVIKAKLKQYTVEYELADFKFKLDEATDQGSSYNTLDSFNTVLKEILQSSPYSDGMVKERDYSYLQEVPEIFTRDGCLHVNTILTDKPEEDKLYSTAFNAFGEKPYILLNVVELFGQGYLFVVGSKAMMFLRGKFDGIKVSKMELHTFEPQQILNITSDWNKDNPSFFYLSKPVKKYGEVRAERSLFRWNAQKPDTENSSPWFYEPANAVWIISDMVMDLQKEPLKANYGEGDEIDDPKVMRQRYYL
ncbi:MAG: hypothetical protein ACFFF4_03040 [Candidatus Thorarchaeota archaeon]